MSGKLALCLPGGGAMSALFQIGALIALEDQLHGFSAGDFDLYIGSSSGASVAAMAAGGVPMQRIYRALLDPADVYFPIERKHLLKVDTSEWRRTWLSGLGAVQHGVASLWTQKSTPAPAELWAELDRLYDSLPAGIFTLDGYEQFLVEFLNRRGVPNQFSAMSRELRIVSHDLDSAELTLFGEPRFRNVSVARACIASMALPPLFSPVKIGDRHYLHAGAAQAVHLDVAVRAGARALIVINPMVAIVAANVPTGHGPGISLRDKGMMWVLNQAVRVGMHRALRDSYQRIASGGVADVVVIEPDPQDCILFMHNPASYEARRSVLEYAYRHTRAQICLRFQAEPEVFESVGWSLRQ